MKFNYEMLSDSILNGKDYPEHDLWIEDEGINFHPI